MKSGAGGGSLAVVWGFLLVFAALCLWPTNGESEYKACRGLAARDPAVREPPNEGLRAAAVCLCLRGREGVSVVSVCEVGGLPVCVWGVCGSLCECARVCLCGCCACVCVGGVPV